MILRIASNSPDPARIHSNCLRVVHERRHRSRIPFVDRGSPAVPGKAGFCPNGIAHCNLQHHGAWLRTRMGQFLCAVAFFLPMALSPGLHRPFRVQDLTWCVCQHQNLYGNQISKIPPKFLRSLPPNLEDVRSTSLTSALGCSCCVDGTTVGRLFALPAQPILSLVLLDRGP